RPLLDGPTFSSFESAIRGRIERKEKAETTLIGFEASDVAAADLQDTNASVTVRFVSEQINVLRNADGQIIDGNPNEVQKVIDLWTFRRDTKSSDPNWLLIKTESEGGGGRLVEYGRGGPVRGRSLPGRRRPVGRVQCHERVGRA